MPDTLKKTVSENKEAVIFALDATDLVHEAMERIQSWPPATKHLGQAMMSAILLQALTEAEDNETVSLQWMCPGPFGHLYTEARNYGEIRGTIGEPRPPNIADYDTSLGPGVLQIRRSKGAFGTTSIVKATGDVSTDIVEYLEKSEQRNCGINLLVKIDWDDSEKQKFQVTRALAYLVHILPQPNEQKMNEALVRWDRQINSLGSMTKWLLRENDVTLDMLRIISGEPEPNIVMSQRVKFSCKCSEERAARALTLLNSHEEKEIAKTALQQAEIRCEYCGKVFNIKSEPAKKSPPKRKKK